MLECIVFKPEPRIVVRVGESELELGTQSVDA